MNLNLTIRVSPDVISQEVSGETVLLDLESEHYFGLDEVGTRIWQLIKETGNLQSVFDTMLAEYAVSEQRHYCGDEPRPVPVLRLDWRGTPLNLAVYAAKDERSSLKATLAGRPIERAGIAAVTALLAADA